MQYRAGTVSLTNGSSLVTGTGTAWLGAVEEGAMFVRAGDRASYTVASVPAGDTLMLSAPYQGVSTAEANYWITTSFTPNRGYPYPEQGDVDAVLLVARAIQEIDADIPETGGGVRTLDDLQDVAASGASNGQVLTRLADGSWGPASPGEFSVAAANLGTGGGAVFARKTGTTLEFRRIKVSGGATLAENADDVTITVPAPGEANTASNVGGTGTVGLFARKTAANLEFRGLRAGAGVTVTQDANDIVVAATGGGAGGGEANTAANAGTGMLQLYRQKAGAELQFRTVDLDPDRFSTALSDDGSTYAVTFRPLALGDLGGVAIDGAQAGHFLRHNADGTWDTAAPPAAGIASVSADAAPTLGGDLGTNGHRILGIPGVISGMLEAPRGKDYILSLRLPVPIVITGVGTRTGAGTAGFSVLADGFVVGADGAGAGGLAGTATDDYAEVPAATATTTDANRELAFRVSTLSPDCVDLCFSVFYRTD